MEICGFRISMRNSQKRVLILNDIYNSKSIDAINSVVTGANMKLLNEYEDDFREFDKKK